MEEQNPKTYQEFRTVVFDLLRNYSKYPAIAKWLTHVFYYFKDLDTNEALAVVDNLKDSDESAPLFIYFAIFRKKHYKNPDGTDKKEFKPEPLKRRLEKIITSKRKKYVNLQGSIAWNFWKLLNENPDEFGNLKDWVDLFVRQPYHKRIHGSLFRIVEDQIEKWPDVCIVWFETLLRNVNKETNTKEKARDFWLTTKTGKVLREIAKHKPEKLEILVKKLVRLWKLGSFVGSPKEILETYKVVRDLETKKRIKKQFKLWYGEMKEINQKLEPVSWE